MWTKQESNIRPNTVELIGNKYWVRRNIKEVTRTDEMSGKEITMFEFEEAKMNNDEYDTYKEIATNSSLIDYIAMETGIDLPNEE